MPDTKSNAKKPAAKKNKAKGKTDAEKATLKKAKAEAAKEKAEAKAKEKAQAREQEILDGKIIEGTGDVEYHRVDREDIGKIQARAVAVLKELEASKTPVVVREVIEKHGGQFPQYLAMFQMLEAQQLVIPFRQRGGAKGEGASQVAYLWAANAA